jgi:hypothetical protein
MQIVLPGALPPAEPVAAELAKRLPTVAPALYALMRHGVGQQRPFDPRGHGCTPYEGWQLEQAGFHPAPGQPVGAGLGPLRAGDDAAGTESVWVADLAHVALGTDRASLVPAEALDLEPAEGVALYEAVRPLFADTPFDAQILQPHRWRVRLPPDMNPPSASPAAVMGQPLNTWWTQDAATRPWRRLLNEIQMVWYEHPVNTARSARGQLPVNAVWLYGGASAWPRPATTAPAPQVLEDLYAPFLAEDWATWLQVMERLDGTAFKPCIDAAGRPSRPLGLTLLGRDRRVTLTLQPRSPLLRWLPIRESAWRTWWSPPV